MNLLQKYILFPRRFGFAPYLWLLWIVIPIVQLFPYKTLQEQFSFLVLLIFAWFYRNSWLVTPKLSFWLIGQYLIIIGLTYSQNNMIFLFLFPAWVVGSLP